MNKQEMAEYIVAIFQNCEAYYKEYLADFGSVLPHVFASEAINGPMKAEFEVNAQSEIFNKYCRLIQHLWKSGDEEVRNAVDVTNNTILFSDEIREKMNIFNCCGGDYELYKKSHFKEWKKVFDSECCRR